MESLIWVVGESFEAPMPVVRQLVFLEADKALNLGEGGLISVERGDVDSGEPDGEVRIGEFRCQRLSLLV